MTTEDLNRSLGIINVPTNPHATASAFTPVHAGPGPLIALSDPLASAITAHEGIDCADGLTKRGFESALRTVSRRK
jgi:hypothetical protein